MVRICDRFGWGYHEYMAQPQWFIGQIILMIRQEHEANRKANKGTKGKRRPR